MIDYFGRWIETTLEEISPVCGYVNVWDYKRETCGEES